MASHEYGKVIRYEQPHHPYARHGERHDGMVRSATAWRVMNTVRTPEPTPESLLIRTSSTLCRRDCEAGGLAHTGLDQRRLAQYI
ncbi:hypothetical protein B296_00048503 [Ensete ventricosum]|uniref:Uncharacterized protein n=1 Tax=Ensete ventricosum TaxID=4639 RepID=A0A426YJK1_ENSVE|nr:hypothetical protein B296_00048503 [Ensete ventricosum]